MPVRLLTSKVHRSSVTTSAAARARRPAIALLNNLSDAGLAGGERQFLGLIEKAAGRSDIDVRLFSLPQIKRGPAARERIETLYGTIDEMLDRQFDGLIVTGCEPMAGHIRDEIVWPGLRGVIDWAMNNTKSALWSCFASHAAVMHLDNIERSRLGFKRSGVFTVSPACDHALLVGSGRHRHVPHSRFYDVDERNLAAHGYTILTRSAAAGVDMFMKQYQSLFVFVQGHPEYDAAALAREYRRDVTRFLRQESDCFPTVPSHYFSPDVEAALRVFETLAHHERKPQTLSTLPFDVPAIGATSGRWHEDAVRLIRNWLSQLAPKRERSKTLEAAA